MSDEELDRLFRESAENSQLPFEPDAWAAMDKKLDAAQKASNGKTRILSALLLSVLLCLLVVFKFTTGPERAINFDRFTSNNQELVEAQPKPKYQDVKSPVLSNSIAGNTTGLHKRVAKPAVQKQQRGAKVDSRTFRPLFSKTGLKQKAILNLRHASGIVLDTADTQDKVENRRREFASRAYFTTAGDYPVDSIMASRYIHDSRITSIVKDSLFSKHDLSSLTQAKQDSALQEREPEKKSHLLNHVQIALAVAPDFTTVKFNNSEGLSMNGGILLAVPLSQKVSLVTGAILANKIYSARPEDYTNTGGYYSGPGELTQVDGTCRVLDIPLNLRYQLYQNQKNTVALQAGISSYLMLREDYTSTYKATYYQKEYFYTSDWRVSNENRHWLAVQNLSVVYSRAFSPSFSGGIEPFLKIPLSGVGAGNVKLMSAGVFLSLGYTISLKP